MKTNTPQVEGRLFDGLKIETRAEKVNGFQFLHGRAVPYNVEAKIASFLETHLPGSLSKSIKEGARDLPLLLFHDSRTWPVGAIDSWEDSEYGLDGVWKLDNSDEAQRAAELADKGMLTGMSIGFVPIRSAWDWADVWNPDLGPDHMDRVVREESRLVEVSLTPTPTWEEAAVTKVRSFDNRQRLTPDGRVATPSLDAWRKELDTLREA